MENPFKECNSISDMFLLELQWGSPEMQISLVLLQRELANRTQRSQSVGFHRSRTAPEGLGGLDFHNGQHEFLPICY